MSVRYALDLLRSLVGVEDARIVTDEDGAFQALEVVPEAGVADHAVVRNVTSALRAALDIELAAEFVNVVGSLPQLAPAGPTQLVVIPGGAPKTVSEKETSRRRPIAREAGRQASTPSTAPRPAPQIRPFLPDRPPEPGIVATSSGNLAYDIAVTDDRLRLASSPRPDEGHQELPRLESVTLERTGHRLRCRVVLVAAGQYHAAMAVGHEAVGVEPTLGAHATVDALRSVGGRLAELTLDEVNVTELEGRAHVIASVRHWATHETTSLVGTAELTDSMELAAALAVLRAALHSPEAEH